jgi:hypothetical protein
VPNKQDLEEENIKDGPTLAKVKQVKSNATAQNISITVIPDKDGEASNLQLRVQEQKITNPDYKHHAGRSLNRINNMMIKEAILAASESSDD